jgi:hypothetical protein
LVFFFLFLSVLGQDYPNSNLGKRGVDYQEQLLSSHPLQLQEPPKQFSVDRSVDSNPVAAGRSDRTVR